MICCALAALFVTAAAAWHGIAKIFRRQHSRWTAGLLAASLLLIGAAALAAHGRERPANEELAAIVMRHICGQHPVSQPSVY
jgi:hypothetical protein